MRIDYRGETFEFEAFPTPQQLEEAFQRRQALAQQNTAVTHGEYGDRAPLSSAQRRLWIVQKLAPNSTAYNVPQALRLSGDLDVEAARRALTQVFGRHEILRTTFSDDAGVPFQQIHSAPEQLDWTYEDLSAASSPEAAARRYVEAAIRTPFDLTTDFGLRVHVYRLGADEHVLLLLYHHIIMDEWSNGVLIAEFADLYQAACTGAQPATSAPAIQYADYALWEEQRLQSPEHQASVDFWKTYLAELAVEPAHPRRSNDGERPSDRVGFTLSTDASDRARALARAHDTSEFVLVWALTAAFLSRYLGKPDLVLSSVGTLRERAELQTLIGFLLNMVPLRSEASPTRSFDAWLKLAADRWSELRKHQRMPFDHIVQLVRAQGTGRADSLGDITLIYLSRDWGGGEVAGLKLTDFAHDVGSRMIGTADEARAPLSFGFAGHEPQFSAVCEFDTSRYSRAFVESMMTRFADFIEQVMRQPHRPLGAVAVSPTGPRPVEIGRRVAVGHAFVHERFEAHAKDSPDNVAIRSSGGVWTYGELNARANRIANTLIDEGVRPGDPVGVSVARSPELIAALLGVLKAGGAYVALQPDLPRKRIDFMRENARVGITVTDGSAAVTGRQISTSICEDAGVSAADPTIDLDEESIAYVLYTSGSTGTPKGVMLPHRAVRNLVGVIAEQYPVGSDDIILQKTPYSFDISVSEIFNPLASGAQLLMTDPERSRDPRYIIDQICEHGVTVLRMTPTELGSLIAEDREGRGASAVQRVLACGEALTPAICRAFGERWASVELVNLWGPTEACVYASWWPVAGDLESVPIGVALPNYRLYCLDPLFERCAENIQGELYAGGPSLARGYLDLPRRTAVAYLPDPYASAPGSTMYRSGDLVAWNAEEQLEFFGRVDSQIQLRGMRIELGDLESALEDHPAVAHAAVLPIAAADGRIEALAAYVVWGEQAATVEQLREHLRGYFEEAKIPSSFVELDEMPRTASGKIDRRGLPSPTDGMLRAKFEPPETESEVVLASIWSETLGLERVSKHDNFFEVGGHSLAAVRVAHAVSERFDRTLELQTLFRHPTLDGLAGWLDAHDVTEARIPTRPDGQEVVDLSSDQQRMWFMQRLQPDSAAYHVPLVIELPHDVDEVAFERAAQALTARHEILRTLYGEDGGEPWQRVLSSAPVQFRFEDVSGADDPEEAAVELIKDAAAVPFDLARETSMRVLLVRKETTQHVALFLFHHIAIDEWAFGVVSAEFAELYAAQLAGRPAALDPVELQYADYAIWQRGRLSGAEFDESMAFWRTRLAQPHSLETTFGGSTGLAPLERSRAFAWDSELTGAVRALARQHQTTEFVVLLALYAAFAARFRDDQRVVIGFPVTQRSRAELRGMLGLLLNTVPLPLDVNPTAGLAAFVDHVANVWRDSLPHHWVPLDDIVRATSTQRETVQSPLFDLMFAHLAEALQPHTTIDVASGREAKAALTLAMWSTGETLAGEWQYDQSRFTPRTVVELDRQFTAFAATAVRDQTRPLGAEWRLPCDVPTAWSVGTEMSVPDITWHEMVTAQASRTPDRIALVADGVRWTYTELDRRANAVAHDLVACGVRAEQAVGLAMERSADLIVAILGIFKSGGMYVPLEPSVPAQRVAQMVQDADVTLFVADAAGREVVAPFGGTVVEVGTRAVETPPAISIDLDQLAYVLYTSGTTGRPKGVMCLHRSIANAAYTYARETLALTEDDVVAAKTPYSFDMFVGEMMSPLTMGASIAVISSGAELQPDRFVNELREFRTTVLWGTPTFLQMLQETAAVDVATMRLIISGGEAVTGSIARSIEDAWGAKVQNGYGPTEACCGQAFYPLDGPDEGVLPIGTATPNHVVDVLTELTERQSVGFDGEILIAGPGLARGYRGMRSATALVFVPSTIGDRPGERMYRTGDVGRWTAAGAIGYRGRSDDQLQVRGVRIELAEVEAYLEALPSVSRAAVVAVNLHAGRADSLAAFLVVSAAVDALDTDDIRMQLAEHLPAAVIPARFVRLAEMPVFTSGKIDRRSLPHVDSEGVGSAPKGATEAAVASVFCEILTLTSVGREQNFFEVGGHSLAAVKVLHALGEQFDHELELAVLFDNPTVRALAQWLDANDARGERIQRRSNKDLPAELPLSSDQQRMWFMQRMEPESVAYHVPMVIELDHEVDDAAFQTAVEVLVDRHEILRTLYTEDDGRPRQRILPKISPQFHVADVSDASDPKSSCRQLIERSVARPFDLAQETSMRVLLVRQSATHHVALFLFHHIAIDEWACGVFSDEFIEIYTATHEGRPPTLSPVALQYADYAIWQQERLLGPELEESLGFWRSRLFEDLSAETLFETPTGLPPLERSVGFEWGKELSGAVREIARQQQTTEFVVLLALYAAFASRLRDDSRVVIGFPVTQRSRPELKRLLGLLLNTIPLPLRVSPAEGFEAFLKRVATVWTDSLPHQWVPLDDIVRAMSGQREHSRSALFDLMFAHVAASTLPTVDVSAAQDAKVGLTLTTWSTADVIAGCWQYDQSRYTEEAIREIAQQFTRLATDALHDAERPLGREWPLPASIARSAHREENVGQQRFEPFPEQFLRVVARSPDKIALIDDDRSWTYLELAHWACGIAAELRARKIGRGARVGVCAQRSAKLIAGLLGVTIAGAAYVPLEPDLPVSRLAYLIDDSVVVAVLCDSEGYAATSSFGVERIDLSVAPGSLVEGDARSIDPAYVIYTSGTTGNPKGVVVPHSAVTNHLRGKVVACGYDGSEVYLCRSSFSFDASVTEIFVPLTTGGTLVIARPGGQRDPGYLARLIDEHRIAVMETVPSGLAVLLEEPSFFACTSLRAVVLGGEALSVELRDRFYAAHPSAQLYNPYGPTEATVESTMHACPPDAAEVTIGAPMMNVQMFVLDSYGRRQVEGVPGQLLIAGEGLAHGYVGKPRLTAAAFLPCPFGTRRGARMYDSGDRAAWVNDELRYLGRLDHQLQVRGVRVELSEVESTIRTIPGVADVVVLPIGESEGRADSLVAYVVVGDLDEGSAELRAERLRRVLGDLLPAAILPSEIVVLDAFPRLPSGKVDRGALALRVGTVDSQHLVRPRTPTERDIEEVWAELLQRDAIGVHQNLFEIGGHSLLAVRLQHRLTDVTGISVSLQQLFTTPTIASFAEWVDAQTEGLHERITPRSPTLTNLPLSSDQQRMWFMQRLQPESVAYHVHTVIELDQAVDEGAFQRAVEALVARHEILRTVYVEVDGQPQQRILESTTPVQFWFEDVSETVDPKRAGRLVVEDMAARPFDLERETSLRALLVRESADRHVALFVFHHIAIDEWASDIFSSEFIELYTAALEGRPAALPPVELQYADYAIWQQEQLHGPEFEHSLEFWRARLPAEATVETTFEAPTGLPALERSQRFKWSEEQSHLVRELARRQQTTEFVVLLALYAAFAVRLTGDPNVVIGSPVTQRSRPELQRMVGLLLNTIPLSFHVGPADGFLAFFEQVAATWTASLPHQWVPLDDIVRATSRQRETTRSPVFDLMFAHLTATTHDHAGPELSASQEAKVGLTLAMWSDGDALVGSWQYDQSRFSERAMREVDRQFSLFAAEALRDSDRPIGAAWPIAPDAPKSWRVGSSCVVPDLAWHEMVATQSRRTPDDVALVADGVAWTYSELEERANALAHELVKSGVQAEQIVGLSMVRSPELIVAILGILKSGAAYVPLEPTVPAERIAQIVRDAGAELFVADAPGRAVVGSFGRVVTVDDARANAPPDVDVDPDQLAYILYTSGTTGQPKGVMSLHRSVANVAHTYARVTHPIKGDDVVPVKSAYSFDMFVGELMPALTVGATVAIITAGYEMQPDKFVGELRRFGATMVWGTPTFLQTLQETVDVNIDTVRLIISGGEAVTGQSARDISTAWGARFQNAYGPTEACVGQAFYDPNHRVEGVMPIGSASANHVVDVVADLTQRQSVGFDGEILIAGPGLARGYRGMRSKTASMFVPSTISDAPGARMYRTGDVGRWTSDGAVGFRGRSDDQLQVRGVRVELAEVEAYLEALPEVSQAAVVPVNLRAGRADSLAAFVVLNTTTATLDAASMRERLGTHLAAAVIPARFVQLDEMPVLSSGKIDRRNLPDDMQSPAGQLDGPTELAIASLWAHVLGLSSVGPDQSFFEVGGHSLAAVKVLHALSEQFDRQIELTVLFENPTVRALAAWLDATQVAAQRIEPRPVELPEELPLSSDQRRMWYLQRFEPRSTAYHVPLSVRLRGDLVLDALAGAVDDLVARHEILRTVYPETDGEPIQEVLDEVTTDWSVEDVSQEPDAAATALAKITAEVDRPFDLTSTTSLRTRVYRLTPDEHWVLLLFHHIAIDEWTTHIVVSELSELYNARVDDRAPRLPELTLQYADYAVWQQAQLEGEVFADGIAFWRAHLHGARRQIDWPIGEESTGIPHPAADAEFRWSPEIGRKVQALARAHRTSDFVALYALFAAFLAKFTGQRDVTIGVPVTMRQRAELQGMVGFLLNTLPLRSEMTGDESLAQWLVHSSKTWRDALPHQHIPFDEIVRSTNTTRQLASVPLFDTLFTFVPGSTGAARFGDLELSSLEQQGLADAKLPLSVSMSSGADGSLHGSFEFDTSRFAIAQMEAMVTSFGDFVARCLDAPTAPMSVQLVDDSKTERLMALTHGPNLDFEFVSVHEQFGQAAADHPDRVALTSAGQEWTYGELDRRSDAVAARLISRGVAVDDVVGIHLERSLEFFAAVLGVLRAGAAYLPLPPDLPNDRISYMASNAQVTHVITHASSDAGLWRDGEFTPFESIEDAKQRVAMPSVAPQNLAYVLYTSGSTGKPKGVMVPHGAIASQTAYLRERYGFQSSDVFLQKTPIGFDASVWEILVPLTLGARLAIGRPEVHRYADELAELLAKEHVTVLQLVPTQLAMLLVSDDFHGAKLPALRLAFCGGEALEPGLVKAFHDRFEAELHNLYGPTEVTINATTFVGVRHAAFARTPIGTPVANTQALVLQPMTRALCPPGHRGELFLGGAQLARGYVHQPALTAERFVPSGLGKAGGRLYKTGDVVNSDHHGVLTYHGRIDHQIKLRGHRIELEEIESVLMAAAGVQRAVAAVWRSDAARELLVGYVEAHDTVNAETVVQHCRTAMPDYMVPDRIVVLETMPLNPSGKIDRAALPAPGWTPSEEHLAPRTDTEVTLAQIWADLLDLPEIGVHQDFFETGGHSLLAVKVMRQVQEQLNVQAPIELIFRLPTIAQFAEFIDRERAAGAELRDTGVALLRDGVGDISTVFVHPVGGMLFGYRAIVSAMENDGPVLGIRSPGISGGEVPQQLEALAASYGEALVEALETKRCRLVGWSFGGVVAFELARWLSARGIEVELITMLDSHTPSELRATTTEHESPFDEFLIDLVLTLGVPLTGLEAGLDELRTLGDEERFEVAAQRLCEASAGMFDVNPESLRNLYKTHKGNSRAYREYHPEPLDLPVHLFVAGDSKAQNGWGELVETLLISELETNHHAIVGPASATVIAHEISSRGQTI